MASKTPQEHSPNRAVLRPHGILIDKHHLPRTQIVADLIQLAQERQCVIVTSPPATGKTTLLQLMEENVRKNGGFAKRFLLSAYTTVEDLKSQFKQIGISTWGDIDENIQDLWLLFDDAQNWYSEEYWPFWQFLIQLLAPNSFGRCFVIITATHDLPSPESPVQFESLAHFREEGLWVSKNETEALFETHTRKSKATDAFFQLLKRVSKVGDNKYHIGVIVQGILFLLQEGSRYNARSLVKMLRRCFRIPENLPKEGHTKLAEVVLCTTDRSIVDDQLLVPYVRAGILAPRKMKFSCLAACCFYNESCYPHRSNFIPNSIKELERLSVASLFPERLSINMDSRDAKRGRRKDPPTISLIDSDDDFLVKQEEDVDSPEHAVSHHSLSGRKRSRYSQELSRSEQRRVPSNANVGTVSSNVAGGNSHHPEPVVSRSRPYQELPLLSNPYVASMSTNVAGANSHRPEPVVSHLRSCQALQLSEQRRVPSNANVVSVSTNVAGGDSHRNNEREGFGTTTIKSDSQSLQQFKFTPFKAFRCQFCGDHGVPDESQGYRRTKGCRIALEEHWNIGSSDVNKFGPFRRPHYMCDPYFKYVKWFRMLSNEADVFGYIMSQAILERVGGGDKLSNILKFCRNQHMLVYFLKSLEPAIEAIAQGEYKRVASSVSWPKIATTGQWDCKRGNYVHSDRPPKFNTRKGRRFVNFWDRNFKEKFGNILADTVDGEDKNRGKTLYKLSGPKQMCIPFVSILAIQRVKQIRKMAERDDFADKVNYHKKLSIELFANHLIIALVYRRSEEPKKTIFGEVAFPLKLGEIYPFHEEEEEKTVGGEKDAAVPPEQFMSV